MNRASPEVHSVCSRVEAAPPQVPQSAWPPWPRAPACPLPGPPRPSRPPWPTAGARTGRPCACSVRRCSDASPSSSPRVRLDSVSVSFRGDTNEATPALCCAKERGEVAANCSPRAQERVVFVLLPRNIHEHKTQVFRNLVRNHMSTLTVRWPVGPALARAVACSCSSRIPR